MPATYIQEMTAGAVDLTITWAPMQVAFGDGGLFELTLAPLSFDISDPRYPPFFTTIGEESCRLRVRAA